MSGVILRLGMGAEELAWAAVFIIAPISGVYYPIGVLPAWMQAIASAIPSSHVFEGMRSVLIQGVFRWDHFWMACALNVVYLALGAAVFAWSMRDAPQSRHAAADGRVTMTADKGARTQELERIARLTLAHYEERADAFWQGTRDHDVSQNIAALLDHIRGEPPFRILDFGCGPGRDLKAFAALGHERSASKARRSSPRWRARTAAARYGSRIS
jgi:hypothetical protein